MAVCHVCHCELKWLTQCHCFVSIRAMAGRQMKRLQRALADEVAERIKLRQAIINDMRTELARLEANQQEDDAELAAIMGNVLAAAAAPAAAAPAAAPDVIVAGPATLRVVSGCIKAVRTVSTQTPE